MQSIIKETVNNIGNKKHHKNKDQWTMMQFETYSITGYSF